MTNAQATINDDTLENYPFCLTNKPFHNENQSKYWKIQECQFEAMQGIRRMLQTFSYCTQNVSLNSMVLCKSHSYYCRTSFTC